MTPNRSMPSSAVIPEVGYRDVRAAVEWLSRAFGLRERLRIGSHRVQMTWGDGAVVATDGGPASTSSILVRVPDVTAHHATAAAAGARIIQPPTDFPYGERQYTAEDLDGHRWTFSETTEDVDPASWGGELVAPGSERSEDGAGLLRIDLPVESHDELAALRGALLAARGSERAEMQRRGARHAFGYGSASAREGMTAEAQQAERRWTMVDRLIRAIEDGTAR